jgi:hypothetical protein
MISLEVAKELKKISEEKGVELAAPFFSYWHDVIDGKDKLAITTQTEHRIAPAYSLEELLEILPASIYISREVYILEMDKATDGYGAYYRHNKCCLAFVEQSSADAAGKLLIELIKRNKL